MPSSRGSSQPRDRTQVFGSSGMEGRFFTAEPPGKPQVGQWALEASSTYIHISRYGSTGYLI